MEMEHINENLIKVLIDTNDLAERGINFLDLIGDQSSIEKFFYSILEEVDVDQHFQESEAVTFQVMPNKDGLELYISRNNFEEMESIWEDEISQRLLERKKRAVQEDHSLKDSSTRKKVIKEDWSKVASYQRIRFNSLEAFLRAARSIKESEISSTLYAMQGAYYLSLGLEQGLTLSDLAYDHPLWTLLEYGELDKTTPQVLQEHGQLIRQDDAIEFFAEDF